MLRRCLYHFSGFLPCKSIRGNAEVPYMERYFLLDCFGTRIYLHRFLGGDAEEAVHDHPWAKAKALVLTGRYEELRTSMKVKCMMWLKKQKRLRNQQ